MTEVCTALEDPSAALRQSSGQGSGQALPDVAGAHRAAGHSYRGDEHDCGRDPQRVVAEALAILDGRGKAGQVPELWDGQAAERVVAVLRRGDHCKTSSSLVWALRQAQDRLRRHPLLCPERRFAYSRRVSTSFYPELTRQRVSRKAAP